VVVYVPIVIGAYFLSVGHALVSSSVLFIAAIPVLADWFTHHEEKRTRWIRVLAFSVAASALVTCYAISELSLLIVLMSFLVILAIALVCVFSLWFGAHMARRNKSLGLLGLAVLAIPPLAIMVSAGILVAIMIVQEALASGREMLMMLIPSLISTGMLGFVTIMMILPFVLLVIASRFYRKRMIGAFVPSLMPIPVARVVPASVPSLPEEE